MKEDMDVYSWFRRSNKKTSVSSTAQRQNTNKESQDEEQLFGITDQLIHFIESFTVDTFKNFPLHDEEGANCGDDGTPTTSGSVRKDLSDWQERHATLVLSKVKELSQLRFRLCPRYLKEQQFWRIYFTLVKSYVAEYELQSRRLAKLKQMKVEDKNVSDTSACEVEMSEAKQTTAAEPSNSLEHNL